jgi:hypothetical protein
MADQTNNPYIMTVADCAGEWLNAQFPSFDAMVATYRFAMNSGRFNDKVFVFGNLDQCDFDDNGLTDDEKEVLEAL